MLSISEADLLALTKASPAEQGRFRKRIKKTNKKSSGKRKATGRISMSGSDTGDDPTVDSD